jgi:hypothetical protein
MVIDGYSRRHMDRKLFQKKAKVEERLRREYELDDQVNASLTRSNA